MVQEAWSFERAVEYLNSRTNYEKKTPTYGPVTFNLERMRRLMSLLDNPQDAYPTVHVTGTKGKGSVTGMVESCARAAGLLTGMYTSPHLVDLRERIALAGKPIGRGDFASVLQEVSGPVEHLRGVGLPPHPTFFEILSASAFHFFARRRAALGVIEVGLGGRLDSTNVVTPALSVLTRIGLDHTRQLGNTLEAIATEKCGIIKPGVPVVSARQDPEAAQVVETFAKERGCILWRVGSEIRVTESAWDAEALRWKLSVKTPLGEHRDLELPLLGRHQLENCALAVTALDILAENGVFSGGDDAIRRGLLDVILPARLQFTPGEPSLLLDGAHNPVSMEALVDTVKSFLHYDKLHLVFAMATDKDVQQCLSLVLPIADVFYPTVTNSPRAMPVEELTQLASTLRTLPVRRNPDSKSALADALASAGPKDLVLVTGSLYLVGDLIPVIAETS